MRGDGDVVGEIAAWSPDGQRRARQAGGPPSAQAYPQQPATRRPLARPTHDVQRAGFPSLADHGGGSDAGRQRTASVEALDRCVAYRIEVTAFTRFLDEHDALGVFTEYLLDRIAQSVQYRAHVTLHPPGQRIAWLLAETLELAGPELAEPRRIPFSQAGIATALGLARSTVAENLRRLRVSGVLAPGPRIVVANAAALRRVASHGMDSLDR
jgi:CRP-like cAMP-binding protein